MITVEKQITSGPVGEASQTYYVLSLIMSTEDHSYTKRKEIGYFKEDDDNQWVVCFADYRGQTWPLAVLREVYSLFEELVARDHLNDHLASEDELKIERM